MDAHAEHFTVFCAPAARFHAIKLVKVEHSLAIPSKLGEHVMSVLVFALATACFLEVYNIAGWPKAKSSQSQARSMRAG